MVFSIIQEHIQESAAYPKSVSCMPSSEILGLEGYSWGLDPMGVQWESPVLCRIPGYLLVMQDHCEHFKILSISGPY